MKKCITCFVLLMIFPGVKGFNVQDEGWALFSKVKFVTKHFKEYDEDFLFPVFDAAIKSMEGKEISLKGHYLPMELKDGNRIILSKFPYSACFFCGGAGPESVAEVFFEKKQSRFKADQVLTVKGILKLNDKDINHMNFIINNAVVITN